MVDRRLPAPATGLPALMTSENKILQIDTKWSEMRKKHKTDDAEFLPVAYGSLYQQSLEVKMVNDWLPAPTTG